jgi:hypothetical protein
VICSVQIKPDHNQNLFLLVTAGATGILQEAGAKAGLGAGADNSTADAAGTSNVTVEFNNNANQVSTPSVLPVACSCGLQLWGSSLSVLSNHTGFVIRPRCSVIRSLWLLPAKFAQSLRLIDSMNDIVW